MGWRIAQCQDDLLEAQAFHSTSSTHTTTTNKQNKLTKTLYTKASLFELWA